MKASLCWIAFLWLLLTAEALTKTKTVKTVKKKTTAATAKKKKTSTTTTSLGNNLLGVGTTQYLYDNDPHVIEYKGDDDTDFKESRMARVVQFYSPYCVSMVPSMDESVVEQ